MWKNIIFPLLLLCCRSSVGLHKPLCSKFGDTYGSWKNVSLLRQNPAEMADATTHFFGGGPGSALDFDEIWLPDNCSYHRFNTESAHHYAKHIIARKNLTNSRLHIIFVGDSAMRGIACGVLRILESSEVYGPSTNSICGGTDFLMRQPVAEEQLNEHVAVDVGKDIRVTFSFVRTLHFKHCDWTLEYAITSLKPYIVFFGTGAWNFDSYARVHRNETATDECSNDELKKISDFRADSFVNTTMREMSKCSQQSWTKPAVDVRIVYKNNHHNVRFGTKCADDKVEALLEGTRWELWDNRRISKDVWQRQCWDGFHFDRYKINTKEEHEKNIQDYLAKGKSRPGQLEMQLAQSALNAVFYDVLQHAAAASHSKGGGETKGGMIHKVPVLSTAGLRA